MNINQPQEAYGAPCVVGKLQKRVRPQMSPAWTAFLVQAIPQGPFSRTYGRASPKFVPLSPISCARALPPTHLFICLAYTEVSKTFEIEFLQRGNRINCWGNIIKKEKISQPRKPVHRDSRQIKQFIIDIQPEYDAHHKHPLTNCKDKNKTHPFVEPSRHNLLHRFSK